MNLFIALLLGHAIGDVYLPSSRWGKQQEKSRMHILHYTCIQTLIYFSFVRSYYVVAFGIFILASYTLIDYCSAWMIHWNENHENNQLINYMIAVFDQMAHFVMLAILVILWGSPYLHGTETNQVLLTLMIVFYIIVPSSILVERTVLLIGDVKTTVGFNLDEGSLIGILERMLIFLLGISGNLGGIGFLIAAKTMVRYGQFEGDANKGFRAKYLVGTLSSLLVGLALYLLYVCLPDVPL